MRKGLPERTRRKKPSPWTLAAVLSNDDVVVTEIDDAGNEYDPMIKMLSMIQQRKLDFVDVEAEAKEETIIHWDGIGSLIHSDLGKCTKSYK
ncbi:hypothetical protein PIB30_042735 [Stylosanthes scabra]|uniref:Uncharacterized protein n=1 Tax=Stylosanthes scabra TaxID=79078 RepID=A0ABU6RFE8_9FABA|nr:hypothetical protein [Stylosanthes scabra]